MSDPGRTPDWLLERIALGELPPEQWAAARARLAREPEGEERLAALEAHNQAVLRTLPPAHVAREVERRARRAETPRWMPALALVPVLCLALLLVLRPGMEETRSKGLSPQLHLHRLGASGAEGLAAGASAAPGDVVQLDYVAAGARFGLIFSVDGRGVLTPHLPRSGPDAARLAPSGTHALPEAYALDDAPAFERFFFITSDSAFAPEDVLPAARALAATGTARTATLPLPARFRQVSFTLEKSPR